MSGAIGTEGEFYLSVTGSIESADFYEVGNAYCKYAYQFGPEWSVLAVSIVICMIKIICFYSLILLSFFFFFSSIVQFGAGRLVCFHCLKSKQNHEYFYN